MERFPEFIVNHPFLFTMLAVILSLLIWNLYGDILSGIKQVVPMEAIRLINHEQAVVIDIRTRSDFEKGHILNAIHLPATELQNQTSKVEKYRKQAVIMYCDNGSESSKAARLFMQGGFEKIYCLKGGIVAWRNANMPLNRETG